jgi:hypothetical protein
VTYRKEAIAVPLHANSRGLHVVDNKSPGGDTSHSKNLQTIRILDGKGHIIKDLEVDPNHNVQLHIDPLTSEVHLVDEGKVQPHLADDCDSDVEMPSSKPEGSLGAFKKGENKIDELKKHLNVTLSDADHLTKEQRERAEAFLWENRDVFVGVDGKVGVTGLVEHEIEVQDSPPIKCHPYRRSPREKEELEKTLDELLKDGKVEPSGSPWAAPVVMVQKKDGTMRFCVDYRKINAVTKKDAYPLPRIDDALDSLGGNNWFHTLDLASGYWQVAMATKDKEKTAFSTHKGLFQWLVMPFGLCNAPAMWRVF